MIEPPISPLARRLAEENNVDWRVLHKGSGTLGERDVLNYLEQVMLGAKPVDPTPEPLPEGVQAWAEEAAPAVMQADKVSEREPRLNQNDRADQNADQNGYKALEQAHHAALAELETLRPKVEELEALKLRVKELETLNVRVEQLGRSETEKVGVYEARIRELEDRERGGDEARRELVQMRETAATQEKELSEARTLKEQVSSLRASLATSEREAQRLQEELGELSARLAAADADKDRAEAEAEGLRAAKGALEGELAKLRNRPWWKVWG